jgi:hypothetical protein
MCDSQLPIKEGGIDQANRQQLIIPEKLENEDGIILQKL